MAEIKWQYYPRVAVHPVARAFVEMLDKRQKAAKTIDAYARNLDDFLRLWPDAPPERIVEADAADIDTYLEHCFAPRAGSGRAAGETVPGRRLADATIHQRLVTVRLFYDFCIQRQLRRNPRNPVPRGSLGHHGAAPQRGLVRHRARPPWIPTDTQWIDLLTDLFAHESLRNQALLLLAYDAALRRQELLGVRLGDIDWSTGLVGVRADHAKNGRARRVPITAATELLLRHYVQTTRAQLLAGFGGQADGPLFLSESFRNPGVPLRPGAFNDILARIGARVQLPQLHPHTFRHLRCTVLRRCGVALDDIALFAGHASVRSTQLYIHLAPTELGRRVRTATAAFDEQMRRLIAAQVPHDR
jgi:integrase/recombinase XerD